MGKTIGTVGMKTKEITVRVKKGQWRDLSAAADCAGMRVEDYIRWSVKLLALQSRPDSNPHPASTARPEPRRRARAVLDRPESTAWEECFAEQLSHRLEQFRDD
ncbi:hypothetical protein [Nocardia brasiliensis]|uniref:hypothetical protein n=1 Tax=Nocardia brasiliensis TaxID=37326 RepID=UPI0011D27D94|nr:hypothetical protein [Nocardia brasiliensis]